LAPIRNRYVIASELNQAKTRDYARSESVARSTNSAQLNFLTKKKSQRQVYKYYQVPIPVYVTVEFEINVITNYQQQLNEIMEKLINVGSGQNYFIVQHEGYRFESFMQQNFNINENITSIGEEERKYTSKISSKTLGYLIGEGANQDQQIKVVENVVEIKFPQERVLSTKENPYPRVYEYETIEPIETFDGDNTNYVQGDGDG
jgi:hypothetical protein